MSKRYRLLKDVSHPIISVPRGDIGYDDGNNVWFADRKWSVHTNVVKNNPDWFKLIEDKEPTAFVWSDELKEKYMAHLEKLLYKTGARFTRKGWIEANKFSQSIPAGKGTANEPHVYENYSGASATGLYTEEQRKYVDSVKDEDLRSHLLHQVRLRDNMEQDRDAFEKLANKKTGTANETINEEKKDWEIVDGRCTKETGGRIGDIHPWHGVACVRAECEIYRVRRLSDNEMFSVGDEVETNYGRGHHTIRDFKIIDGNMCVGMPTFITEYEFLTRIKKYKPKPTANDVSNDKEFEVVTYKGKSGRIFTALEVSDIGIEDVEINSVKRLSDGVVFSTGDIIEWGKHPVAEMKNFKIEAFSIHKQEQRMMVSIHQSVRAWLSDIKKLANDVVNEGKPSNEYVIGIDRIERGDLHYEGNAIVFKKNDNGKYCVAQYISRSDDLNQKWMDDRGKPQSSPADESKTVSLKLGPEHFISDEKAAQHYENYKCDNPVLERNEQAGEMDKYVEERMDYLRKRNKLNRERWDIKWENGTPVIIKHPTGKWILIEAEGRWIFEQINK